MAERYPATTRGRVAAAGPEALAKGVGRKAVGRSNLLAVRNLACHACLPTEVGKAFDTRMRKLARWTRFR